ncbi:uncharacterized protein LOC114828719 isoform X2 [Esox lucius]|uniref:uncharacterized protein LOC114828719 isoform X2 n=1 Tax=Esox lucius TaxID=8010 RepID=UPI00147742D8|nr:uncharacterized protein LOC114828719 isoform X2 [Esox lucius]
MTLFIPDVATGRLFLVILIFYQSHRIPKTKIWKKKSSISNLWFCLFTVTEDDLIRHLQSVGSQEVSCDYRVSSGPNSLSPRSDGYNITTGSTVSTVSTVSTHKAPVRPTSNLLTNATLIPKSQLRPTTSSTTSLTSMATSSGGQSSTENVVKPNPDNNLAVGLASGVGVFLVGLTAVCLYRKTKRNKSQSPQAQQDDYNEQFVMETNRCGSLEDSGHDGFYSVIPSVPSTFLPSERNKSQSPQAQQDDYNEQFVMETNRCGSLEDSGHDGFYSVIPSVPSTFLPSGPVGENGQSSEHDNEYCTIPDRPAVSAQIDGLYSLLQTQ